MLDSKVFDEEIGAPTTSGPSNLTLALDEIGPSTSGLDQSNEVSCSSEA